MKVAVCISGYSKESIPHVESWLELFNSLNCQVDYYAHFWDNNVDMIVSKLNIPLTGLVVESEQRRRHVSVELPEHDTLYSFMRAANLKKQDEIKNHHFYDVCISLNINVKFNQTSITQFKNLFVKPEHNFVHTFNSENVGYFPFFKLNNDSILAFACDILAMASLRLALR